VAVKAVEMPDDPKKPNNLRTGLILLGVALFFALALVVKRTWLM
jgi:hypothetical protein